jgi:hypothetical protein
MPPPETATHEDIGHKAFVSAGGCHFDNLWLPTIFVIPDPLNIITNSNPEEKMDPSDYVAMLKYCSTYIQVRGRAHLYCSMPVSSTVMFLETDM